VSNLFRQGLFDLFSMKTIAIFMICYFFLAVITSGISVPGGLVIPMLTIGVFGRHTNR
jgi:H+/Cl- antiporter ClcA